MRMTPAGLREAAMALVGLGVIVHQTVVATEPSALLIGGALALLGIPSALIADRRFKEPPPAAPPPDPEKSTTS